MQHAALADGALWYRETGGDEGGARDKPASRPRKRSPNPSTHYWSAGQRLLREPPGRRKCETPGKELDFATILAVIHAGRKEGAHSVRDPKVMATLARLEELFDASYPINRGRPENLGPALGRYAGDRYFSGGAYYFSTLGAAEFYYSLAEAVAAGAALPVTADNETFLRRLGIGDDILALSPRERSESAIFGLCSGAATNSWRRCQAYTPASGELSEQFDQATGAQTSAKTLTWSHAAFITAFARREAALRAQKAAFQTGASR